jgi:hypothetical protein
MLRSDADTAAVLTRHRAREGVRAERRFDRAIRGFTASLDARQRTALAADPSVLAVVPDEVVAVAGQVNPTGVSRVGARLSAVANIDNVDDRVDADVAIVDTGVATHADLNVVGGVNCSTSDRTRWADENGHGTHVAGTVAARDNDYGVVGVAPGARIWAVRILNADGYGLLSWYVCGLDWILAQRDPNDPSRPLIEAVNMSVAKSGSDDLNCGLTNKDVLHQGICRLFAGGITVVAAAANEHRSASNYVPAAYNEVITTSALADTDGRSGSLGGNLCYSWGGYDQDDTFADFSNYGSDVDLIAPGKCIWSTVPGGYGYSSGTSMAAPAVTGAVALYKASRPQATPTEVREALRYLGNAGWKTWTDPDSIHEPLLGVSRLANLGTFSLVTPATPTRVSSNGGTATVPVTIARSASFFERVRFGLQSIPAGWSASMNVSSLYGWAGTQASVRVTVPPTAKPGTYELKVVGTNWGRVRSALVTIEVGSDPPTARAPRVAVATRVSLGRLSSGANTLTLRPSWASATDPSDPIVAYQVEHNVNGGTYGGTVTTSAGTRQAVFRNLAFGVIHRFRVRAQDSDGIWSPWAESVPYTPANIGDRSSLVTYGGPWWKSSSTWATGGSITSSGQRGATARHRFTGRGVAVIAPTYTNRGKANIYIDGVYRSTIDLATSSPYHRRVVWAHDFGASGTHTIELRVLGTSGRPTVSLDGFVILR